MHQTLGIHRVAGAINFWPISLLIYTLFWRRQSGRNSGGGKWPIGTEHGILRFASPLLVLRTWLMPDAKNNAPAGPASAPRKMGSRPLAAFFICRSRASDLHARKATKNWTTQHAERRGGKNWQMENLRLCIAYTVICWKKVRKVVGWKPKNR